MKKFIYMFMLPVIALVFNSCEEDDDVMNTKLIKGQWEVVSENSSDYACIYNFTTQSENTWSWGELTTYYITTSGSIVHDKLYDWHVSDPDNYDTVYMEITLKGLLDGDDPWENTDYFIVEKLTSHEMVLRKNEVGDSETRIKFRRRNDLKQP